MSKTRNRRGYSPDDLRREVESGKRLPFYLLHGEEEFERDEICAWLTEALAPEQARDFNLDIFRADEFAFRDFHQVYSSYPMMASYRLLVLKGCEKLTGEHCKELEGIVDDPLETSLLIAVGGKIDQRRKFFQQLGKQGQAVEFRVPYDNQIPQWIQRYARRSGLTIEPEAGDLLRLLMGGSLRELVGEIAKLRTYVGEGHAITRQAVEQGAGDGRNISIFQLTDVIGRRDRRKSLELLHDLLDKGEEPSRALAMIYRHFQLLLKAQVLMGKGRPERESMARNLGVSPYFVNTYIEQARAYPNAKLWAGMGALLEADSRLKSQGRRQERLVMDLLVERLCRPSGKGAQA